MAQPTIIVEHSPAGAAHAAAARIAALISAKAATGKDFSLALCGGTTPGEMYRCLAAPPFAEQVPWGKVQVFFGDERDVPQDHVENNYRLAAKSLLDLVPVPLAQVHPMPADCRDLAAAAEQYENLIRRLVPPDGDDLPAFDLVLLGMGGEGHTASLFPDTPALAEKHRLVVAQYVPVIGRNRMTFTFPLINAARCVLFLVTGADKAQTLAAVLGGDEETRARYPAGQVRPTRGELVFIVDFEAARLIQPALNK